MMKEGFSPVLLRRLAAQGRETLADYREAGGYLGLARAVAGEPQYVLAEVSAAELLGRGGAAFPAARKWELAARAEASQKYVVANGGEHEPGSGKDRALLERHPHAVLEGLAIAAFATGASRAYVYIIEDMTAARASIEAALAEATAAGFLGESVCGSAFDLEVSVALAPTTYVAGEETAALEVIEGRQALPRKKPPFPGESGLFGAPTIVNNVETLAHVPGIMREGAAWFRALGVAGSAGTFLATLDASVHRPGVYELPFGRSFRELVEGTGGGLRSGLAVKALLPALSSAFLPGSALDTPMDHASLRAAGTSLGCAGLSLVDAAGCLACRAHEIAGFFMTEQCGQCPPCRMATNTFAAVLGKVRTGEAGDYRSQLEKVAAFTRGKGNCSLIAMAATPVLSALALFPEDFAHHAAHGRCPPAAGGGNGSPA